MCFCVFSPTPMPIFCVSTRACPPPLPPPHAPSSTLQTVGAIKTRFCFGPSDIRSLRSAPAPTPDPVFPIPFPYPVPHASPSRAIQNVMVSLAGRIVKKREQGKLLFYGIKADGANVQVMASLSDYEGGEEAFWKVGLASRVRVRGGGLRG